jgi:hypothetical protein
MYIQKNVLIRVIIIIIVIILVYNFIIRCFGNINMAACREHESVLILFLHPEIK